MAAIADFLGGEPPLQTQVVLGQTCRSLHKWFSDKFDALAPLAPPIWQKQARWLSQNRYADNTMRSPFVQEMILHLVIEKWRKAAECVHVAPLPFAALLSLRRVLPRLVALPCLRAALLWWNLRRSADENSMARGTPWNSSASQSGGGTAS